MKIVNIVEFNEIIKEGVTLVDFYADWCGPCRMLAPVLEEVAEEVEGIEFVKVNVDNDGDLASTYSIHSIPTLLIFKDGTVVSETKGYQSKEQLLEFINNAK